jgi:hypothetical protein
MGSSGSKGVVVGCSITVELCWEGYPVSSSGNIRVKGLPGRVYCLFP